MLPDTVLQKLDTLPAQPGCYLFKDKKGAVVYVGKAKSLRSRVRSYFQPSSGDERYFIPLLHRTVGDLETIVTASEKEAAILEDSLIKEHQPRYNVKLRDDKSYICLRISTTHRWPRVEVVRRPSPDGARYFGPYHSATAARRTLHLVNKHFQLRTCTDQELEGRKRPCLQYQIRRCLAPCVYEVDEGWYRDQVRAVGLFLDGRHDELSRELEQRMRDASKRLEYELAATYRDQLRAVDAIRQEQRVVAIKDVDQDVVGLYREGDLVQIAVVFIRSGKVNDTAQFPMRRVELPEDEIIAAFLSQYYEPGGAAVSIPDEVIVPVLPDGADGTAEWLSERRGKKCDILAPQRGPRVDLLNLAVENARHAFHEQRRAEDDVEQRLGQIQRRLRLPTLPRRIECCDISHLGGNDTVGAIVALLDGQPDKKRYRTFRVKTAAPGDDYGAMFEVLARRFRRGRAAREAQEGSGIEDEARAEGTRERIDWDLPDLFVVDGGRGQLNIALAAARDLGLHDLPIVGLAKERPVPGYPPLPKPRPAAVAEAPPTEDVAPLAAGTPVEPGMAGDERAAQEGTHGEDRDVGEGQGDARAHDDDAAQARDDDDDAQAHDAQAHDGGAGYDDGGAHVRDDDPASEPGSAHDNESGREDAAEGAAPPSDQAASSKARGGRGARKVNEEALVDRVYLPGQKNGIPLQPNSAALFFLARARDEAHRFSNRARERIGKTRRFRSELDDIPGIGPATRRALLKTLGSVEAVRQASDEAILAVPGVTKRALRALRVRYPGA